VMRYAVCVKRTTIMLPDEVDARLRLEARRRGSSIADVAREAIDRQLPHPSADGRLSFFSVGEGSRADVSERVEEFVGKAVARRKSGRSKPGSAA
jgi:Ribbon-helix-helix protein, copG family